MNTAHTQRHAISPRQIKAIHAAVKNLGLDDATYRARLKTYGAHTCKDLTWRQAEELLDVLNGKGAPNRQTCPPSPSRQQYADLDGRPGYASGAQCRLIAAMFHQITRAGDPEAEAKALNTFCSRIVGVSALRMVRSHQVEKIVKALESMGAEHKGART